jgi:hypothetical protein
MNLDEEIASLIGKASDEYADAFYKMLDVWQKYMLFTWRWWLDLALAIIPWIIWLKVRDKVSTHRLLYAGFIVMMLTSFLDMLGMSPRHLVVQLTSRSACTGISAMGFYTDACHCHAILSIQTKNQSLDKSCRLFRYRIFCGSASF